MTPREFRTALRKIKQDMGTQADVWVMISSNDSPRDPALLASAYVNGMVHGMTFSEKADTFDELLEQLTAKWASYKEEHERQFVRKLALRIIEITAETGECTDAALRGRDFTKEDVIRYGERACAEADDIAGRGPFKLRMLGGANNAPAERAEH